MSRSGYFRYPAIQGERLYFVAEDDVWCVSTLGGKPFRLTAGLGGMGQLAVSPDGRWLAVTAREEKHHEVFVASSEGGPLRRLTFLGADTVVRGFTPDGRILFSSNTAQPLRRLQWLYALSVEGGEPEALPFGCATEASFGTDDDVVIGRNTGTPAHWKRYRGGTAGRFWIRRGGRAFQPFLQLNGNLANPMWIDDRVYFLSDHEGVGNVYSCQVDGTGLQRHTDHEDYYVRSAVTDGDRIAYHSGGDLYVLDLRANAARQIDISWHAPSTQTQRKFVPPGHYLESFQIHPSGHSLALTIRGKAYTMGCWEEAVRQVGQREGVRHQFAQWLHDGQSLVSVTDSTGEDAIEVFSPDGASRTHHLDLGRVVMMAASPKAKLVAVTNHRMELQLVDLDKDAVTVLDQSHYYRIEGLAWSPDGAWLAYAFATSRETSVIKLAEVATGKTHTVTRPDFRDFGPVFDPEGKYLYFLSHRVFDPVYDTLVFDLSFPRSVKPYLVVLSREERSPFIPKIAEPAETKKKSDEEASEPPPFKIDIEGIADRVLPFPMAEGIYRQIGAVSGKVFSTLFPVSGSLNLDFLEQDRKGGDLVCFDFKTLKAETVLGDVLSFRISADRSTLVYRSGNRLRAVRAAEKIDKPSDERPSRQSGWIDLARVRVSVDPRSEWRQMYRDIWRLQRDYFWVADMSGVDWQRVFDRYRPLLERVATRSEFSDLIWEMQGELGTSHAYEMGGDYRPAPDVPLGFLGADFRFDAASGCYRIAHLVRGDSWISGQASPMASPGIGVREGDRLLAVGGQALSERVSPESLLVHQAGALVEVQVANADGSNVRTHTVRTVSSDQPARYRDWLEGNRQRVHERTGGRCGYVHIPNMGPLGFSEFNRYYIVEAERDALIVDVRFNGGGHISPLILEKLGRKRLGYDVSRWGAVIPYPPESVLGPMVALANEHAGSDGDMFSHAFKMMKLGPLVGKRTWGGVVGISPKHRLVDGSLTTQPENSFWFRDVGWGVENYGTDPDIEVEVTPEDYVAGRDPQLERGIALVLEALEKSPPVMPDFTNRPNLALPALPTRPR